MSNATHRLLMEAIEVGKHNGGAVDSFVEALLSRMEKKEEHVWNFVDEALNRRCSSADSVEALMEGGKKVAFNNVVSFVPDLKNGRTPVLDVGNLYAYEPSQLIGCTVAFELEPVCQGEEFPPVLSAPQIEGVVVKAAFIGETFVIEFTVKNPSTAQRQDFLHLSKAEAGHDRVSYAGEAKGVATLVFRSKNAAWTSTACLLRKPSVAALKATMAGQSVITLAGLRTAFAKCGVTVAEQNGSTAATGSNACLALSIFEGILRALVDMPAGDLIPKEACGVGANRVLELGTALCNSLRFLANVVEYHFDLNDSLLKDMTCFDGMSREQTIFLLKAAVVYFLHTKEERKSQEFAKWHQKFAVDFNGRSTAIAEALDSEAVRKIVAHIARVFSEAAFEQCISDSAVLKLPTILAAARHQLLDDFRVKGNKTKGAEAVNFIALWLSTLGVVDVGILSPNGLQATITFLHEPRCARSLVLVHPPNHWELAFGALGHCSLVPVLQAMRDADEVAYLRRAKLERHQNRVEYVNKQFKGAASGAQKKSASMGAPAGGITGPTAAAAIVGAKKCLHAGCSNHAPLRGSDQLCGLHRRETSTPDTSANSSPSPSPSPSSQHSPFLPDRNEGYTLVQRGRRNVTVISPNNTVDRALDLMARMNVSENMAESARQAINSGVNPEFAVLCAASPFGSLCPFGAGCSKRFCCFGPRHNRRRRGHCSSIAAAIELANRGTLFTLPASDVTRPIANGDPPNFASLVQLSTKGGWKVSTWSSARIAPPPVVESSPSVAASSSMRPTPSSVTGCAVAEPRVPDVVAASHGAHAHRGGRGGFGGRGGLAGNVAAVTSPAISEVRVPAPASATVAADPSTSHSPSQIELLVASQFNRLMSAFTGLSSKIDVLNKAVFSSPTPQSSPAASTAGSASSQSSSAFTTPSSVTSAAPSQSTPPR